MREISVPADGAECGKKRAFLQRTCKFVSALTIVLAVTAVLALLGVLVSVVVAEFKSGAARLCYILAGAFGGGALLFALFTVLAAKGSSSLDAAALDFLERCDGMESFFIGEGTFATFGEGALTVHGEKGKSVKIPYAQIRAFSVCMRQRPREKGEWLVVLEIPARYLSKKREGGPLLVQTDAKDRLLRVLEKRGISLLGEKRIQGAQNTRFTPEKKFVLPDGKRRRHAIRLLALGAALAVAACLVGVFWNAAVAAVFALFGAWLLVRGGMRFSRAKSVFGVYREGIWWQDADRRENKFLKWEEIEEVREEEEGGVALLSVRCPYGVYRFPRVAGALEYVEQIRGGSEDLA